ncbi:hypothetical protein [Nocardia aurea]|uniref:hypothetical protein n=1 Tax=Nocardia aurea TaxID=2144174 RepID=UPI0033BEF423
MSSQVVGATIAIAPFVAIVVALMAWTMSDAEGRRGGFVVFGFVTAIMCPILLGLFIAGNPAWMTGLAVIAGLDLWLLATAGVMVSIGKIRQTGQPQP